MSVTRARALRKTETDAEGLFWHQVRGRRLGGYKFRRQCPIGKYVVDFLCLESKVIVEIDGGQHNDSPADEVRDQYLSDLGFKVVRFWNNEVFSNMEGVLSTLTHAKRPSELRILSQRERELSACGETA